LSQQQQKQEQVKEEPKSVKTLDPAIAVYFMYIKAQHQIAEVTLSRDAAESAAKGALDASRDVEKWVLERLNQEARNHGTIWRAAKAAGKKVFRFTWPLMVLVAVAITYIYLQANPGLSSGIARSYDADPWGWIFIIISILALGGYLYWRFGRKKR
jgi:hypothetical protein